MVLGTARHKTDLAFLGHEALPPSILGGIISPLMALPAKPLWCFEGKFEPFYTSQFIHSLADAGCRGVIFGLESSSDRINRRMKKHRRGIDIPEIERMIGDFDRAGIAVNINTIYNLPGTTSGEFRGYKDWIRKAFDKHRFLQFNTNGFLLFPGSKIARNPRAYGIRNPEIPDGDFLLRALPQSSMQNMSSDLPDTADTIWEHVFGTSAYLGCSLEQLHAVYHEGSLASFWDASHGRNLFKYIQSQLSCLESIADFKWRIPDNIELVESDSEAPAWVWLIDIGGVGGQVKLACEDWNVLETCVQEGRALRDVLKKNMRGSHGKKNEFFRQVKFLASNGFLEILRQ